MRPYIQCSALKKKKNSNSSDSKVTSLLITLIMLTPNVNLTLKFIGEFLIISCKKKKEVEVASAFPKVCWDRLKKKYMDNYH